MNRVDMGKQNDIHSGLEFARISREIMKSQHLNESTSNFAKQVIRSQSPVGIVKKSKDINSSTFENVNSSFK